MLFTTSTAYVTQTTKYKPRLCIFRKRINKVRFFFGLLVVFIFGASLYFIREIENFEEMFQIAWWLKN